MTVKYLSPRTVPIKSLVLPGDMRKRMKEPHVLQLGQSMGQVGMLHLPIVRHPSRELLSGGDRVAALMVRKQQTVVVRQVECTDREAQQIRLVENCERRHNLEKQREERAEMMATLEQDEQKKDTKRREKGAKVPRETPKGRARKEMAKQLDITPDAIRKQEQRTKHREEEEAVQYSKKLPEDFETFGLIVEGDLVREINEQTALLEELANFTVGALSKLSRADVPHTDSAKAALKTAGSCLRSALPVALCPWCKGFVADQCAGCQGTATLPKSRLSSVPQEYMNAEKPVVMFNGQITPLERIPE